jgi:hypothetical protein
MGSGNKDWRDNSNGDSDDDGDSSNGDSGDDNSNSDSGSGDRDSGGKNNNQLKPAAEKEVKAVDAPLASIFLASWAARQVSKAALRVILQRMLRASYSQHTLRVWYSQQAESIILSAGNAKQQSTKTCSVKCGDNGGGRDDSGGGDGFVVGSRDRNCSDDSNSNCNVDGDMIDSIMAKSEKEKGKQGETMGILIDVCAIRELFLMSLI